MKISRFWIPRKKSVSLIHSIFLNKIFLKELILKGILFGELGGKGVMLLNMLKIDHHKSPFIVDINPALWGKYVPGTGNKIINPKELANLVYKDSVIWIMNTFYLEEIRNFIRKLGFNNTIRIF